MGHKHSQRVKNNIIVQIIGAILVSALFLWTALLTGVDNKTINFGNGMYPVEISSECNTFTQTIRVSHYCLCQYGFYLDSDTELIGGGLELRVLRNEKVISSEWIEYSDIRMGKYTYVDFKAITLPYSKLKIQLVFEPDDNGNFPVIFLSPESENLKEMSGLEYGGNEVDDSLLSSIAYSGAMEVGNIVPILVLLGIVLFSLLDRGVFKGKKIFLCLEGMLIFVTIGYLIIRLENAAAAFPVNEFPESGWHVYLWSIAIIVSAIISFMLLVQSFSLGGILAVLIMIILYSTEYFVRLYRGMPFRLNDLRALGTLAEVSEHYTLKPSSELAWCWLIGIFLVVILVHFRRNMIRIDLPNSLGKKKKIVIRTFISLIGLGLLTAEYLILAETSVLENHGFARSSGFFFMDSYNENGYVVSSLLNVEANRVNAPVNYSEDAVADILTPYLQINQKDLTPNVILIGNESFADLTVLGDIGLSEDILKNFYSIENATRGFATVSAIGGGTANSEYESLSGCSTAFMPDSYYPYLQSVDKNTPTIVGQFKNNGYRTISMHPFKKTYNRGNVYKYIGFDESYWGEDFEEADIIDGWVSDRATYDKIIELFENKDDTPMFILDFTIQNHGGYEEPNNSTIIAQNANTQESSTYFLRIKESDEAFQYLIDYFSTVKEPTVICMYGDHQPKFEDETFYDSIDGLASDDIRLYKTPFIIWANYEIETENNLEIGLCYLPSYLLSVAGVHMSPYLLFVKDMMDLVPDLSVHGCYDSEGVFYSDVNDCEALNDYRIVQYNNMYDKNRKEEYYR